MKIIAGGQLQPVLERALNDYDSNTTLVQIENADNKTKSDFPGLDLVLEMAPEGKPILMHTIAGPKFLADNPKYQAAMGYPNVSMISIASLAEIKEAAKEIEKCNRPKDEIAIALVDMPRIQDEIKILKHDLYHVQNGNKEQGGWIERAQKLYGSLPFEELAQKVEAEETQIASRFEGQELKGIFVDVEGTLLQNGEVNQELVSQLEEKSKEKPITIWTDADIKEIFRPLRNAGLYWKILPKELFAGAKVEEVYDDLTQEDFETKHRIKTEIYNQISAQEPIREGSPTDPENPRYYGGPSHLA
jgi:hypothetical protein